MTRDKRQAIAGWLIMLCLLALAQAQAGFADSTTWSVQSDVNGVTVIYQFGAVVLRDAPVAAEADSPPLRNGRWGGDISGARQTGEQGGRSAGAKIVDLPGCARLLGWDGLGGLPQLRTMVGVAQEGAVRISVSVDDVEEIPNIVLFAGENQRATPEVVVLEGTELLRNVRVARLLISPVQYFADEGRLRVFHRVTVRLHFSQPARKILAGDDPFASLYSEMLLNGAVAKDWQVLPTDKTESGGFFDRSLVWVKIKVESTGVYRITWDDIKRLGVSPSLIDPRSFRMFNIGAHVPNEPAPEAMKEIPIVVQGEADSSFDRKDEIWFYAQAVSEWDSGFVRFVRNPFTRNNVYWLTWGAGRGQRMAECNGVPESGEPTRNTGYIRVRVEQDRNCPARSGLLWIWNTMTKPVGVASLHADYDLGLKLPVRIIELAGKLYSTKADSNCLSFYLNRQLLGTKSFTIHPASNPFLFSMRYDSQPCPGWDSLASELRLELNGAKAMEVLVDYFDVAYERRLRLLPGDRSITFQKQSVGACAFSVRGPVRKALVLDITDPFRPHRIVDYTISGDSLIFRATAHDTARYYIAATDRLRTPLSIERRSPGRLNSAGFMSHYLIVAPDPLYDAAQALQRYRTGRVPGNPTALVRTVRLSEVYDDFSFGLEEPMAIKQLFRAKRPSYGLLLGDATYDYRDQFGLRPPAGVPPYETGYDLDPTEYSSVAVAIDGWYADFDGAGLSPDMFLGRVTARTPVELEGFTRKLITYETGNRGYWCKRVIMLADDEFEGLPSRPDGIGLDHTNYCETITALLGNDFEPAKVYLTEYPLVSTKDKPGARERLTNEIRRGALLLCFFGHGAAENLTHENVLPLSNVPLLVNDGRAPFCFFGSCAVGRWEESKSECIAEDMVRKPDGGAIATIGASKATNSMSNLLFAQHLFNALKNNRDSAIGRAFVSALPNGMLYHLFGDPATRLAFPHSGGGVYLESDSLYPGAVHIFGGTVPLSQGDVAVTLGGNKWLRTYISANRRLPPIAYVLSGDELYRGTSRVQDRVYRGSFIVPTEIRRGTRTAPDGNYVEIARSARLSVVAASGAELYSGQLEGLSFGADSAGEPDHQGPEIALYADGRRLSGKDTSVVPASFTLTGKITDRSGVLISPSPTGDAFFMYVSDYRNRTALNNLFSYDAASATSGSFSCPVTLNHSPDSVVVVCSDNLGNSTRVSATVRVQDESRVTLSDNLVYPNPVSGSAYFTFRLSAPASATLSIHSLSGRLLRELELPIGNAGYRQIVWDGRDGHNVLLPNGVYLYVLKARATTNVSGREQTVTALVRDKFIIRR